MGLLDILSGGGSGGGGGLYGDLLNADQKDALQQRGLLGFLGGLQKSGALDYTVPFVSGRVPAGFAAGLAGGMAGMGDAQDKGAETALTAILRGLQGQQLKANLAAMSQEGDVVKQLIGGGGAASGAAAPSTAAPGGGMVAGGAGRDPRGVEPLIRAAALKYGHDPDTAVKVAQSEGLGTFYGDGGKSGTAFQLYTGGGLGNEFQKETGLDPLDPKNEPVAIDWAMKNLDRTGWSPYHGAKHVGVGARDGISVAQPGAVAQAGALPSLPDFTGLMAFGHGGAAYAPAAPAGLLSGGGAAPASMPAAAGGEPNVVTNSIGERYSYDPNRGWSDPNKPWAAPQGPLAMPAAAPAAGGPLSLAAPIAAPMASPAPAPTAAAPAGVPGGINPQAAQALAFLRTMRGATVPDFINQAAGMPFVGPKAAAEAQANFQYGKQPEINAQTQADIFKAVPIAQAQNAAQQAREEAIARLNQSLEIGKAGPIRTAQNQADFGSKVLEFKPGQGAGTMATGPTVGMPELKQLELPDGTKIMVPINPLTGAAGGASFNPSANPGGGAPSPRLPTAAGGALVTGIGPGAETSLRMRAEAEQKSRQQTIDAGASAQAQQATLQTMKADAPNFYQGLFADHVNDAKAFVRLLPGGDAVADQVASYESFIKNAGALTRQAVKDTSPRAAVQEFKLINSALPNPENSPLGFQRVANEYMGLNDYHMVKTQAQNVWESNHGGPGNVTGFETDWQSKTSPYAFIVMRMDQADRQKLFAQVAQTKGGQAELAHLGEQMRYIQQSGLEQFIR